METQLQHFGHKVGVNFYHFEWATKYRYEMMGKFENKNLVAAALRKAAHENKIQIQTLSVMPEHVHMRVSLPYGMTPSKAFQILKGRSAYIIFHVKEKFRLRYPQGHFWSAGGCATSVGYNDINAVDHYIKNQATHHNAVFT